MKISKHLKLKSWLLLGIFITETLTPSLMYALTSGPSQPEVHSFEPISTNQMVDLFSGDFTYNIPLLTVPGPNGGYPINIAYHSGIGMEQEATWVGLGWNLSPGVINRQMRGLPDDFKNAQVQRKQYTKPNRTYAIGADAFSGTEVGGFSQEIGVGMSIMYNNYKGIGIGSKFSTTSAVSFGTDDNLSAGLSNSLNFDPYSGLGYSPSLSLSKKFNDSKRKITFDVGVQFHAIEGYQGYSTGISLSYKREGNKKENPGKIRKKLSGLSENEVKRRQKKKDKGIDIKGMSNERDIYSGAGASTNFRAASTFAPSGDFPTRSKSYTVSFKPGGAAASVFVKPKFDATYSENAQYYNSKTYSAYGFMNLEASDDKSLIDFNRENRLINKNTRFLPFPNATYDIYQVKGQGIGGVFKPYRNEEVLLHDPSYQKSSGGGVSLDGEFGAGIGTHFGGDFYTTSTELTNRPIGNAYGGQDKSNARPFYEPFYFKASGELTSSKPMVTEKRAPRVQNMTYRTIAEMEASPRYKETFYNNYDNLMTSDPKANLGSQIGELSVLGGNGTKYVYGIPAFNNSQTDYSTAISSSDNFVFDGVEVAEINQSHLQSENGKGTDEFYSESKMPKYAYSYLLTSVLSTDYVDLTNNGPSEDDLGYYTHFKYNKHADDYKWRAPYLYSSFSEANINLKTDNKASFTYGDKEMYYLKSIETKTHIAKFTTAQRRDAYEAYGVLSDSTNVHGSTSSEQLNRIDLFSKLDLSKPIKTVHFEYDYSLCKGVYNNIDATPTNADVPPNDDTGKLTLKKVYFTHGNSIKGTLNPYKFNYDGFNPDYSLQSMDRWGNYKPQELNGISSIKNPYVDQSDNHKNNLYTSAWNLTSIETPSGGEIEMEYESDDYQYVQDKKALQLLQVTDINYNTGEVTFKYHPNQIQGLELSAYTKGIDDLYFKVYNKLKEFPTSHPNKTNSNTTGYDYVEGYAKINHQKPVLVKSYSNHTASFFVEKVKLKKKNVTPFQQAAIHKLKLERSDVLTNPPMSDNGSYSLLQGIQLSAEFFGEQFKTLISGYLNHAYKNNYGKGGDFDNQDYPSFVRLNVPNNIKYGGGARIKTIKVNDNWSEFTSNQEESNSYGKEYIYKLEDGTSSGVAENEPVFGGEESPLRKPIRNNKNDVLLNDEILTDKTVSSSVMPSAGVGYSRVIERSIHHDENATTGIGQVVSEYYTAKEYPFSSSATKKTSDPEGPITYSVPPIGGVTNDFQSYKQHYTVLKNDMHGKSKRITKYKTRDILFYDGVNTYEEIPFYERQTIYYHSDNKVIALNHYRRGGIKELGVTRENYKDTKFFQSYTEGYGGQINIDYTPPAIFTPSAFPRIDLTNRKFWSTVTSEITNRNALIDRIVVEGDGTYAVTQNEMFDEKNGAPLLTSTSNEFGDKVFDYSIPGHWYYPTMGHASYNDRAELKDITDYDVSGSTLTLEDIDVDKNIFLEGDQVELYTSSGIIALWVKTITIDNDLCQIELENSNGTPITSITGDVDVMIVESANKNLAGVNVGGLEYQTKKNATLFNYLNGSNLTFPDNNPNGGPFIEVVAGGLKIANKLNPTRIPNEPCEGSLSNGFNTEAYSFFNVAGAYIANFDDQTLINNTVEPNSLTFFVSEFPLGSASNSSSVLSASGLSSCKATIYFPEDFVTDFTNAGGANSSSFGNLQNYNFNLLNDDKLKMTVNDNGQFKEYICVWEDLLGCFDVCIVPINASATVFENDWTDEYVGLDQIRGESNVPLNNANINPHRYKLKGVWRPKRNYVYQVERVQSGNYGNSTNIRRDGSYTDYHFFDWYNSSNNPNWTGVTEMTKYSPYGYNLEVQNALGMKSSNLIGYNHSLVIASAQNANYYEIANENFEETPGGSYVTGSGHLEFVPYTGALTLSQESHTGNLGLAGQSKINIPVVSDEEELNIAANYGLIEKKEYVLSFWAREGAMSIGSGSYSTTASIIQGTGVLTSNNLQDISIDGWRKFEYVFKPIGNTNVSIRFLGNNGGNVIIDDVRIHPFNSSMTTYVYNPTNYRYLSSLDGQNMATFYSYDEEGRLTQIKKETSSGIRTLKSSQAHLQSNNP